MILTAAAVQIVNAKRPRIAASSANVRNARPLPMQTNSQRFIIAMPTRGTVSAETVTALHGNTPGQTALVTVARRPVVEARNELAQGIAEVAKQTGLDLVLWVDDDAWWPRDTLARMLRIMETTDVDMLAPLSTDRRPFCSPAQFRFFDGKPAAILPRGVRSTERARFTPGELVDIDATSFHFVLMRIALLERLGPQPFNVPDTGIFGEDMQFCFRAKRAGARLACDTGSIVAHVEADNGLAFIPISRPGRIIGNAFVPIPDERTDEAILEEWELKNIRADRRYGADVDAILMRTYKAYIIGREKQKAKAKR